MFHNLFIFEASAYAAGLFFPLFFLMNKKSVKLNYFHETSDFVMKNVFILEAGTWFLFVGTPSTHPPSTYDDDVMGFVRVFILFDVIQTEAKVHSIDQGRWRQKYKIHFHIQTPPHTSKWIYSLHVFWPPTHRDSLSKTALHLPEAVSVLLMHKKNDSKGVQIHPQCILEDLHLWQISHSTYMYLNSKLNINDTCIFDPIYPRSPHHTSKCIY